MSTSLPFTAADEPWLGTILGRPALRLSPTGNEPGLEQRLRTERLFATAKIDAGEVVLLQALPAAGRYVVDVLPGFPAATNAVSTKLATGRASVWARRGRVGLVHVVTGTFQNN